jgi:glyoxylase-like metal-dependent hydrolase (beta-lactamase superfamily II)
MSATMEMAAVELGNEPELLDTRDVLGLRAANPGPLTLSGTNTWLVGRDPTWVIDPGPRLPAHLAHVRAAIAARGGLGGVALTHGHRDHSEAAEELLAEHPAPLAAGACAGELALGDGVRVGPLEAVFTPGHAPDHYAFIGAGACFTGDAVLGEGSVFISPGEGSLAGYLAALERLRRRSDFTVLCPGHGPVVWQAHAKLEQYLAHRAERERRLLGALAQGHRTTRALLDAAWPEVPAKLRPAAAVTLAAHLEKLEEEGRLPAGVERPRPAAKQV